MAVDRTHLCRRVESTPPHWKIQGWKVESIRRSSSSKYDILITTPPPGSQKIRSLKGLTRFITEHNITTLSVEDLNSRKQSISWKKTTLEGICRCVGPKTRATPNSLQLAPAVDKCRELRDGIVEESRDSGEREQLPVGTELGFEVHLAGRGNLPRGVTAGPETQSAVCVTEAEMLDADSELKTEESLVSKVVGDCDPTHVPLLSVRSAEVLVGGVAAHDRTVGRASVDGGCGEEREDVGSSPSSGSHCSTGTWVPTTTEGDSIVDKVKTEGGHEESQSTDGGTSPERVQGAGGRSRRKQQGQCVSPYFRKSGRVVSSLPQCVLKRSKWLPPRSPFGLIQEDLYHDPFQLLVATVLLNKTRGEAATPVIWKLLEKWPTAEDILKAAEEDLVCLIQPLGLQRKRAFIIKKFADEFLCKLWTYPDELYGISKYGADSYRIFCVGEWQHTRPTDHMLLKYVKWLADKHINELPTPPPPPSIPLVSTQVSSSITVFWRCSTPKYSDMDKAEWVAALPMSPPNMERLQFQEQFRHFDQVDDDDVATSAAPVVLELLKKLKMTVEKIMIVHYCQRRRMLSRLSNIDVDRNTSGI